MNKMLNIGTLTGKLLIFGGAYSNLQAVEALRQVARQEGIDPTRVLCTGDSVGYCADPEAVVQVLKEWGIRSIAGNVEVNLRDKVANCGCNFRQGGRCDLLSNNWYSYAQSELSEDSLAWIGQLPDQIVFRYAGKRIQLLHGSARNLSEFVFPSSDEEVKLHSFSLTGADVILAGHSGIPFVQEMEEKIWLNAGVIGMPANDGTPRTWYCIINDTDGIFTWDLQPLHYSYKGASQAMSSTSLPSCYARSLVTGVWDNMEILPEAERLRQGIPLAFSPVFNHSPLTQ